MPAPLVSVVMPTFNRLRYVRAAVASVYNQTLPDWELIVVDDGSDEATRAFLRSAPDSRMSVVFHSHTGVPAVMRNDGIARARGRYVAFLDSDDQWAADKLERQLALMETEPDRLWSYTAVRRIDSEGREVHARPVPWVPYAGSILEQILTIDAQIATPSVIAHLSLVRELGGFDERLRFIEDYDLWARLALRSDVSVVTKPLADVRTHPDQFTLDRVGGYRGWISFYEKMEKLVPTTHLHALCRRRMNEYLLLLAAEQARTRDWEGMSRTAFSAVQSGAWRPRGWLRIAKAAALSSAKRQ